MNKNANRPPISRQPGSRESGLFAPAAERGEPRSGSGRAADLDALGQLPGEDEDQELNELDESDLEDEVDEEESAEEEDEYDEDEDDEEEEEDEEELETED